MNYEKIHNQIIKRAKNRKLEGYFERHHIIPRCMGGTDEEDNLVELTAKEHFIVHKLLTEIYPNNNKIHYSAFLMAKMKDAMGRDYRVGSREYQRLKENVTLDDEQKKKISESMKGKQNCLGRKLSKSHRDKISKSLIGHKRSLGKKHTKEHKEKISNTMTGRIRTKEHSLNLSKSVLQYDLEGNFIQKYQSIREAGKVNGLFPTNISCNLKGKSSHCGGFIWKYEK